MTGWIEVIVGGMFSGKTEELIRRLRRAHFARQKIQVFKPIIDSRYSKDDVTSHNMNSIASLPISSASEIFVHLKPDTQVVGIDEGQFFQSDLIDVVQELAIKGMRVIIAGLDTDWKGQAFEPMPVLMAIAENVTKQHAVCVVCGSLASRTQRTGSLSVSGERVLVGSHDHYEARCRAHFKPEVVEPTKTQGPAPSPQLHPSLEPNW